MSIAVYNIKGGVGKTTLSVQISQMLNYMYVSNDPFASAHNLLDASKVKMFSEEKYNEIPFEEKTVYDFGGFFDKRISNIIKKVDKVVIPTLTSIVDVQGTLATLNAVLKLNKNVVIVINRAKNNEKAIELRDYLLDEIAAIDKSLEIEILFVRDSSPLEDSLFDCLSIVEKAGNNRFRLHQYRNPIEDLSKLTSALEV